jgi:hypothetical protein
MDETIETFEHLKNTIKGGYSVESFIFTTPDDEIEKYYGGATAESFAWGASMTKTIGNLLFAAMIQEFEGQTFETSPGVSRNISLDLYDIPLADCIPTMDLSGTAAEGKTYDDAQMFNIGLPADETALSVLDPSVPFIPGYTPFMSLVTAIQTQASNPLTPDNSLYNFFKFLDNASNYEESTLFQLRNAAGTPIQSRISEFNDLNLFSTMLKDYDPTKPNMPTYSTQSSQIAGVCAQNIYHSLKTQTPISELTVTTDMLKDYHTYFLNTIAIPLGFPSARLGGTATYIGFGVWSAAPTKFFHKIAEFLGSGTGKINEKQVIPLELARAYLDPSNYRTLSTGPGGMRSWYRGVFGNRLYKSSLGMWQGELSTAKHDFIIGHGGFGGFNAFTLVGSGVTITIGRRTYDFSNGDSMFAESKLPPYIPRIDGEDDLITLATRILTDSVTEDVIAVSNRTTALLVGLQVPFPLGNSRHLFNLFYHVVQPYVTACIDAGYATCYEKALAS